VISYWMILLIGWLFIGQLALQVRRGRWPRQALATEAEAGPEVYETSSTAPNLTAPRTPTPSPAGGAE
jgi:hypothetical protein